MEIMSIETVEMMATSGDNAVSVFNSTTDDDAAMGRGRRGSWGDLWGGE